VGLWAKLVRKQRKGEKEEGGVAKYGLEDIVPHAGERMSLRNNEVRRLGILSAFWVRREGGKISVLLLPLVEKREYGYDERVSDEG